MSEWKEYQLSEIMELIGGGTPKTTVSEYWDGNIPWLSVTDFNTGKKYCFDAEKKITERGLRKSSTKILKKGQLIISARGTVGVLSVLGRDMAFNQSCYGINAEKNLTSNAFLYYILKYNIASLQSASYGAVFDTITKETFSHIAVFLPPLPEQRAIASVLSSLDDKIDLLHRQNQTLEAMAEALFRQWFVEEAEEGWEEGTLGDIANNVRNTAKIGEFDSDCKYVALEHIERRNIALKQYSVGHDVSSNKYYFEAGDILFGKLRPYFHKVCFTSFSGICSTDILVIRPKNSDWFLFCLFAFFQNEVIDYANLGSGGTRMPRTDWKTLAQYPIAIPDVDAVKRFNKVVLSSLNKIQANLQQIRTLSHLRDTLLPKLMSGEVRVQLAQGEAAT